MFVVCTFICHSFKSLNHYFNTFDVSDWIAVIVRINKRYLLRFDYNFTYLYNVKNKETKLTFCPTSIGASRGGSCLLGLLTRYKRAATSNTVPAPPIAPKPTLQTFPFEPHGPSILGNA